MIKKRWKFSSLDLGCQYHWSGLDSTELPSRGETLHDIGQSRFQNFIGRDKENVLARNCDKSSICRGAKGVPRCCGGNEEPPARRSRSKRLSRSRPGTPIALASSSTTELSHEGGKGKRNKYHIKSDYMLSLSDTHASGLFGLFYWRQGL